MEHSYCAQYEEVLLRPLHRYDIEYLRRWRNQKELNRFLTAVGEVTEDMQEKWFGAYLSDPDVVFFAVDYRRCRTVGSIALYEFEGETCQIGKVVIGEKSAGGQGLGLKAFLMTARVGMECLGIRKFLLSVHEENARARAVYEKLGFRITGSHAFAGGGKELEMEASGGEIFGRHRVADKIYVFQEDGMKEKNLRGVLKLEETALPVQSASVPVPGCIP